MILCPKCRFHSSGLKHRCPSCQFDLSEWILAQQLDDVEHNIKDQRFSSRPFVVSRVPIMASEEKQQPKFVIFKRKVNWFKRKLALRNAFES